MENDEYQMLLEELMYIKRYSEFSDNASELLREDIVSNGLAYEDLDGCMLLTEQGVIEINIGVYKS